VLRAHDYGPVRYFSLARSRFGRTILTSGVYFVDGLLIDTGPANAQLQLARVLGRVRPDQVVLTHHHEDHIGNALFVANHIDRPPLAHPLALPLVRRPGPLPLYRRITWGTPQPFAAEALGKRLATPSHRFEVIHTPGHAPDHIALYEPEQRWLFAGDLFIAAHVKVLRADENVSGLIASLRKLLELPDCTLFCQHTGMHSSHHKSFGRKLDFLLSTQRKAVALRADGRSVAEIAAALDIRNRWIEVFSRGEFSGRNLIAELLRDAEAASQTPPAGDDGAAGRS